MANQLCPETLVSTYVDNGTTMYYYEGKLEDSCAYSGTGTTDDNVSTGSLRPPCKDCDGGEFIPMIQPRLLARNDDRFKDFPPWMLDLLEHNYQFAIRVLLAFFLTRPTEYRLPLAKPWASNCQFDPKECEVIDEHALRYMHMDTCTYREARVCCVQTTESKKRNFRFCMGVEIEPCETEEVGLHALCFDRLDIVFHKGRPYCICPATP